ncbi:MAG: ETC complex I subunit, partial [Rhodospirillaceae bacterium]
MPDVRIYQPRKTAMQSGRAKTRHWLVEFEPGAKLRADPLMGWAGHGDTRNQLRMKFETRDDAIAFCTKHGLDYHLIEPRVRKLQHKSYADNFRFD